MKARVAAAEARALEAKERELEAREKLLELEGLLSMAASSCVVRETPENATSVQESLLKLFKAWRKQKQIDESEF